ncbi:MAG: DNA gyrase subunit A [Candidatus Methanofastidiosa archaeon]|nr:DNA gyrase subunit A [Candidatus Methanofastidiosa archaeon]
MDAEQHIIPVNIEDEMKESYLNYAMSVIASRALPDVRDGLKPVQRRILHSMYESGITAGKPHKKSARVVGDVLGKYHPHGDSAVYDTMVRMAQPFSLRYPLIDGQGNFGSIDGDSAAAMRYTEARMSRLAEEIVQDIDKETVPFVPNYDNSLSEPLVMPSKLPNLLLNGVSGIAVGMATKIPPHNLCEVVDGITAVIDNPELEDRELYHIITGPDFPTGGTIYGAGGIYLGYHTGRGSIKVRAEAAVEEKPGGARIIVTEIPYEVNKTTLIEQIAELVKSKHILGIRDLRDESDRKGMRIVIELKKEANPQVILNQLYTHTNMQTTFSMNMLALVDNRPEVLTLRKIITYYVQHRYEIVRRRTQYELDKALRRAHILEGLIVALDNIDAVIALIKAAETTEVAKGQLIERFALSPEQAQAILDMRLSRLTSLEQDKIRTELAEIHALIADLRDILSKDVRVYAIIKEELAYLKEKYGDERRTRIVKEGADFEDEDLIPQEDVVVTLSHEGYVKSLPVDTYRMQKRGGVGILGSGTKEEDFIEHLFVTNTHHYLLFFTNRGKVYWKKAYEVPQAGRQSKGKAIINLLNIEQGELVSAIIPVQDFSEEGYLLFSTKKGYVKKTPLAAFSRPRAGGIIALSLDADDELIKVRATSGNDRIVLGTKKGYTVLFHEHDVRAMGRSARGVKGITLGGKDEVVGMDIVRDCSCIFTITREGYGKKTPASDYPVQRRGGRGVINIKTAGRNGPAVAVRAIEEGDELMVISSDGNIIRLHSDDVSTLGRNTQGVRIMKLREGDRVSTVARLAEKDDETE